MKASSVFWNAVSLAVALLVGVQYREWQQARVPVLKNMERSDFKQEHGWHPPYCSHPMVFRNALDFGAIDHCKNAKSNPCAEEIKQRLIDIFGDREMEAFHNSHVSNHDKPKGINWRTKKMTLKEYFTKPENEDYIGQGLIQLGTTETYRKFLSFDTDKDPSFFDLKRSNPTVTYAASQFFIAKGVNSGTNFHFAFGQNDFLMIAGRKKWIFLDPAYMYDASCRVGFTGLYGTCHPGYPDHEYLPPFYNISIDEYKHLLLNEIGIPKEAILEVTLHPGDMLISCAQWGHAVQNLDELAVGYSFRFGVKNPVLTPQMKVQLMEALVKSIYTKVWFAPGKFTLLDVIWRKILGTDTAMVDEDDRFDGHSFINSDNGTHSAL